MLSFGFSQWASHWESEESEFSIFISLPSSLEYYPRDDVPQSKDTALLNVTLSIGLPWIPATAFLPWFFRLQGGNSATVTHPGELHYSTFVNHAFIKP